MSIIDFFNKLGIIQNTETKNENDPALLQGQQLMNYTKMYRDENKSRYSGIPSMIESMSDTQAISGRQVMNTSDSSSTSQKKINQLEDEFIRTLTEYNSLYKIFSEEVMNTSKADKEIQQYYGQAVTTDDGNYSYINNYGYTHKFSNNAWLSKSDTCPSKASNITTDINNKFDIGPDMGVGQACEVAGKNIRNSDTGENAWVDIKGYKHVYSSDVWTNKQNSCDVPVIKLTATQYNAIPSGGSMTTTDYCLQLKIDPGLWTKLMKLNNKLMDLAENISKELSNAVNDDIKITNAHDKEKKKLDKYRVKLNKHQSEINIHKQRMNTISGNNELSKNQSTMEWLHLIAWILLLMVVTSIIIRAFFSEESSIVMDILAIIATLCVIYILVIFLAARYS